MTTTRFFRIPRLALALAIVIALAVGLYLDAMLTSAGDYHSHDYQAGQASAASIANSKDNIVIATVGREQITIAEFTEGLQRLHYMKDISQRELDGRLETGAPKEYLQGRHDIVGHSGDDNTVLAGLVYDSVMYQKAVDAGLSVSAG